MSHIMCYKNHVIDTLIFPLTIQSIPEIIPTTTKGLVGATPSVTSSPIPGAFCDNESQQPIVEC